MRSRNFKTNIEADLHEFKEELALLRIIQQEAQEIATKRTKAKKEEIDKIGSRTALTAEDQDNYTDFFRYGVHFNSVVIHSLVVAAFAFFEDYLYQVMRWLDEDPATQKPLDERWGIKEYRKHFHKAYGLLAADSTGPVWQQIVVFEKIRHLIVHHHNRFDGEGGKNMLIRFLKNYNVHLRRDYAFKINDSRFLDDCIANLSTFSVDLAHEIYKEL